MEPTGRPPFRMLGNKVFCHLLILVILIAPNLSDCPSPCTCKWISGKKTANCIDASLTNIPDLNAEIQVLDLRNNFITHLQKDAFSSIGLMDLQKIFMKNITLREMNRDAFNHLKILIEVDLSDNQLSFLPRGAFSDNERLKILTLSGNPLKMLTDEQFPPLPHLRTLELANCQLDTIQTQAFIHLSFLQFLNLNTNRLESISKEVFLPITKLKSLSLDANPWKCNCHLRSFRNWYLASNLNSVSLSCAEPVNLKDKFWENILDLDFGCHPEVNIVEDLIVNKDLGDNVTLHCLVKGDPEPKAIWQFNGVEIYKSNHTNLIDRFIIDRDKEWTNLTILDLREYDSGEFICEAKSYIGAVSANVSVIINQVMMKVRRSSNYWFLFTGLMVGGLIVFILITSAVACGCMAYNRKKRRKQRRKAKAKGNLSKSFYDQEKHLLDMSSSNTEQFSRKSSCERLGSQGSMELLKNSSSVSIDRYNPARYINRRQVKEATAVIPLAATFPSVFGVYPPPPEFSSPGMPQSSTLGNIFISVSLSPDPQVSIDRYPDLLDSHRRSGSRGTLKDTPGLSDVPILPFATLPRRQLRSDETRCQNSNITTSPRYDNMGRRVNARGNSTLSLHQERDNIPSPPPPPLSTKPDFDFIPL